MTIDEDIYLKQLTPHSVLEKKQPIELTTTLHRIVYIIKSFFQGGMKFISKRAFQDCGLQQWSTKLLNQENLTAEEAVKAVKVWSKFCITITAKYLQDEKEFKETDINFENLLNKFRNSNSSIEITRWIDSNKTQRIFAAYMHCRLPYLYKEIQPGSVLLWPIQAFRGHKEIQNLPKKPTLSSRVIRSIKHTIISLFTDYDHADFVLNNSEEGEQQILDVDKEGFGGVIRIANRTQTSQKEDRICAADILLPNKEEISQMCDNRSFEEIMGELTATTLKAKDGEQGVKRTSLIDMLRIFTKGREALHNCQQMWAPQDRAYSCSGTIAALLGSQGIDVGEEANKTAKNIAPADYLKSRFFTHFYSSQRDEATW